MAEFVNGIPRDLFLDVETIASRQLRFMREGRMVREEGRRSNESSRDLQPQ